MIENRLRDRTKLNKPSFFTTTAQLAAQVTEPKSYHEANNGDDKIEWRAAMLREYESHCENNTWTLVQKPDDVKILDNRWIYKIKRTSDGFIDSYKARLVIKGFKQIKGVDYNETFASVCRYESIRLLLCIAATDELHVQQFDVKTAFLHGDLKEVIYMHQPEGFVTKTKG